MINIFTPQKKQQTLARSTSKSVLDQSGDITESETVNEYKSYNDSEPSFVKEYLQDQTKLCNLKKGTLTIFKRLFPLVVFDENLIILNVSIKKELCLKLGIQLSTLNNALNELKKSQLLIHIDTGIYMLNVFYYAKGHWSKIKKIRSQIIFKIHHSDPNDESSSIKNIEFNFENLVISKDKYDSTIKRKVARVSKLKVTLKEAEPEPEPETKVETSKLNIDESYKMTLMAKIIKFFQFNKTSENSTLIYTKKKKN